MRMVPGDWADRALCAQVGGDVFFPELGESIDQAKAVCRVCEVRAECLEYALRAGDRDGIFGGFTERVRRRVAREYQAGRPLEDIIAEDDEAFYARIEAPGTPQERRLAAERRRRRVKIERLATASPSNPQPVKAAA